MSKQYFKTFYNPNNLLDSIDLELLDKSDESYYLKKDLNETQIKKIDAILNMPIENKMGIENVFIKSANIYNREHSNYKLYPAQIDPVLMAYINPRLFISDSPGLGKTIEAGGIYAYYRLQQLKSNLPVSKVIVVAETIHVLGFEKEWKNLGINLLPLHGGNAKIKKERAKFNSEDYDGIVINWDGLKTNEFVEFWLENYQQFNFGIFDETSCLRNPKSALFRATDNIVNKYQGGLERVVFLNGTPFEKDIYDYYYQFMILKPKLIPSKSWIDGRYVIKEGKEITLRETGLDGSRRLVTRRTGEIVDYKNQEELKDRLKYYLIGRSKEDFSKSGSVPNHSYILHLSTLTREQKKILELNKNMSLINSPETSDSSAVLNVKTSPKLKDLLEFIPKVDSDRPLIYVENTKSQETIVKELELIGYRVGLINGYCNVSEKDDIVTKFENRELDILVFNIKKSLSIKTSERIIFYDIPTMPQETLQISARIDRDNYDISKFYDFFCYAGSPEMVNIIQLAYFREQNSNKFTGKKINIYQQLVNQLINHFGIEKMSEISSRIDTIYENNAEIKDVNKQVEDLLNI